MNGKKYKDQCDLCKKFDYLKGCSNGMCLCEKCRNTTITIVQKPKVEKQLTLFDTEVLNEK